MTQPLPPALEFDRIVAAVRSLALTPLGEAAIERLAPAWDPASVTRALDATSETVAYLERQALFPLRAGAGLADALDGLTSGAHALEPLQLRLVADFLDSVDMSRRAIGAQPGAFPILAAWAAGTVSFAAEVAAVRRAIDVSGDVLDTASPALAAIRDRLRQKRQRLRGTLEQFIRSRRGSGPSGGRPSHPWC